MGSCDHTTICHEKRTLVQSNDGDTDTGTFQNKRRNLKKKRSPKTRSKSGCFTCRKRKKKCDEAYPVCSGCSRNFMACSWPNHRTETLPKHFEIKPSAGSNLEIQNTATEQNTAANNYNDTNEINTTTFDVENTPRSLSIPPPGSSASIFELPTSSRRRELISEIKIDENDEMHEEYDIPLKLCSVIQLHSYKHDVPFSLMDVSTPTESHFNSLFSPEMIWSVDGMSSVSNTLPSEPIDAPPLATSIELQSVNQMFSSLYDTLKSDKIAWTPSIGSDDSSIYQEFLDTRIQSPTVSDEGSNAPPTAAVREMLYACGNSYLGKKNGSQLHIDIANKHYTKVVDMIRKPNNNHRVIPGSTHGDITYGLDSWVHVASSTLDMVERFLGLGPSKFLLDIRKKQQHQQQYSKEFEKRLFTEFTCNLGLGLYFAKFEDMIQLPNPFQLFDKYREQFSKALFEDESSSSSSSNEPSNGDWLNNVVLGATLNCLENLCKLFWLLRMSKAIEKSQSESYLTNVNLDMSLTWTTLQTADIQLDMYLENQQHGDGEQISEDSVECINKNLSFAKTVHQSCEILRSKLSDDSFESSSPVVVFYLDQLIESYQSIPQEDNQFPQPRSCILAPLFIAGCASKSLTHREFISKELYLISQEIGSEFTNKLIMKLEDSWCVEERQGETSLSCLISRFGFENLPSC